MSANFIIGFACGAIVGAILGAFVITLMVKYLKEREYEQESRN